jgi:SAM-dependent methyltransferase
MTWPLSPQTYSACLLAEGKIAITPDFLDAFRHAGRRPWPGAPDREALERVRALVILVGPGWQEQLQSTRDLVREAVHLHGAEFPIIPVLLPGCEISAREAETRLDFGGCPFDLREDASHAALIRVAECVPPVCVPLQNATTFHCDPMKATIIESYDAISGQFTDIWAAHPPIEAIEKLIALVPPGSAILDAGCGPGHHTRYLTRRGHEVTGVDLSEGMLSIARRSFFPSRFVRMDIERLQFTMKFDAIWCAAAAMHVPRERMPTLLARFHRYLQPKGVIGLNLQVGRKSEVACFGADRRFFEYYESAHEIASMLEYAGFDVLDDDYGETERNTHSALLTLHWQTLYARPQTARRYI